MCLCLSSPNFCHCCLIHLLLHNIRKQSDSQDRFSSEINLARRPGYKSSDAKFCFQPEGTSVNGEFYLIFCSPDRHTLKTFLPPVLAFFVSSSQNLKTGMRCEISGVVLPGFTSASGRNKSFVYIPLIPFYFHSYYPKTYPDDSWQTRPIKKQSLNTKDKIKSIKTHTKRPTSFLISLFIYRFLTRLNTLVSLVCFNHNIRDQNTTLT